MNLMSDARHMLTIAALAAWAVPFGVPAHAADASAWSDDLRSSVRLIATLLYPRIGL